MYKIPSPKGEIRVYDSMEEFRNRKKKSREKTAKEIEMVKACNMALQLVLRS